MANNMNGQVKLEDDKESLMSFRIQQPADAMNFLSSPIPQPEPSKENKFKDRNFYKTKEHMMDLAFALNAEAGPLDPSYSRKQQRQKRWNKFAGKYQVLYENSPGLYWAALMGELMDGDIGQIVRAFTESNGDPTKIQTGFDAFIDRQIAPLRQVVSDMQKQQHQLNPTNIQQQ